MRERMERELAAAVKTVDIFNVRAAIAAEGGGKL
jgi:hypothetical protein